jgi:glycosyltransferase involved in cell wall biosynthesis
MGSFVYNPAMARVFYSAFDTFPSPKGATTHIVYFLRGLVNNGDEVELLTPGDGILPVEDVWEGVRVRRVPPISGGNFLTQALAFGQAALELATVSPAFDFVHYRSAWSGLPLAQNKARFGFKTIFEVNGLVSVELKYHYPGLRDSGLLTKVRQMELEALELSDAVICPSDVTRQFLVSLGVEKHKITVIPNGGSPDDFYPTPLPARDNQRIPTLLYIGTLADWQGLEIIIKAMPQIIQQRPAHLRIVGRGRSRQRKILAKQIRKLGLDEHVSLEGAVPHHQVADIIASADVCLAPLALNDRNVTQGCCPIKIIEYMACARPIVASNLPVVRELVREDIDALLFNPGDFTDLAAQVLVLLENPSLAEKIAANASQRARDKFTWHAAQKKLLQVYRGLM